MRVEDIQVTPGAQTEHSPPRDSLPARITMLVRVEYTSLAERCRGFDVGGFGAVAYPGDPRHAEPRFSRRLPRPARGATDRRGRRRGASSDRGRSDGLAFH